MTSHWGACLYKEARLNIEPSFPGSTIAFTLPTSSLSTFGSRPTVKRTVITEQYADQDEQTFARRNLATEGSIYFRQHHQYPRSFLWRVLDNKNTLDSNMLEIQAIDLDHDYNNKFEANLTLLFQFPSPIRPFCVAFAEPTDRDCLTVYAITTSNDLYTLHLHREFFCKPAASELDVESWCKRSEPTLLSGRTPYRLHAHGVDQLLVTLDDGAILRMEWDKSAHSWEGSRYQNNSWSVRGLLSWKSQPTVRYESANAEIATSAVAAVAMSPDKQHILSVSLDYTLKAWNVVSGKCGAQVDMLGREDYALEKSQNLFSISPAQPQLMVVLDTKDRIGAAAYHIMTYCPKLHRFQFWGVKDADDVQGFYDCAEGAELVPPIDELFGTTVWTMEDFHVTLGPSGLKGTEIWIRARSGPSSRVYTLKFDLDEHPSNITRAWKHNWVSVDSGPSTVDGLKNNPTNPAEQDYSDEDAYLEITEQWLSFLFFPGRFTLATLESALCIFKRGSKARSSNRSSLKERICTTVVSLASAQQKENESSDVAVSAQWQAYYGLVKDLHKRRGESLSLAYDPQTSITWHILSDQLSAIRTCSELETISLNMEAFSMSYEETNEPLRRALDDLEPQRDVDPLDVVRLLNAASSFRRKLPRSVQRTVQQYIEMDLLQSRPLTIIDRMEWIERSSGLEQHVTDEDLSQLVEDLGTEVKDLSTDTFLRAIKMIGYEEEGRANARKQLARYGLQSLLKTSQELLEADHATLLDLLTLVLFMFVELEGETLDNFDASEVFVDLISEYKERMVIMWLASTVWSRQGLTGPASEFVYRSLGETFKAGKKLPFTQTVLEGIYGVRAFDPAMPTGLKAHLLTYWSRAWIASIYKNQGFNSVNEDVMGYLLGQREYGLAQEFSKFLVDSNWSTYLKGRLHVALGEYALASVCFEKAAYNLALGMFDIEDADKASLVSEIERNSFSSGLPRYYNHVIGLFDKVKAYSFMADFAQLGLRSLKGHEDAEVRNELLQRLFTALIHASRFQEAYSTLARQQDAALKRSDLQKLVEEMISQSRSKDLLTLPLVGMAADVDAILTTLCQKTLNIASGPPYHQILYSFRISRNDFRGAASILYERLQRLKSTSSRVHDPADESLVHCYLTIINTLSSVGKDDAYILAEQKIEGNATTSFGIGQGKKLLKRQIVTLDTLRKEYHAELDRVAAIESGQFPFVDVADDMDIL